MAKVMAVSEPILSQLGPVMSTTSVSRRFSILSHENLTCFALERAREGCDDIIAGCLESELDHCCDIGLFPRGNIFGLPLTLLVEEGFLYHIFDLAVIYTVETVRTRHYSTICNYLDENHGLCGRIDARFLLAHEA